MRLKWKEHAHKQVHYLILPFYEKLGSSLCFLSTENNRVFLHLAEVVFLFLFGVNCKSEVTARMTAQTCMQKQHA